MLDMAPRFPPPEHLLPRSSFSRQVIPLQAEGEDMVAEKISRICTDIRQVQDVMRVEINQRDLWNDTMFRGLYIFPIIGDLLAIRVDVDGDDGSGVHLEAFRLGAILYVNNLRAKFGVDTLPGDPLYAGKLQELLSTSTFVNETPSTLLVWVLSVAATSQYIPDQRDWFIELFTEISIRENIGSYGELMAILTQLVWDESLLDIQPNVLQAILG